MYPDIFSYRNRCMQYATNAYGDVEIVVILHNYMLSYHGSAMAIFVVVTLQTVGFMILWGGWKLGHIVTYHYAYTHTKHKTYINSCSVMEHRK